jgi:predicted aconitase with swiveling domain
MDEIILTAHKVSKGKAKGTALVAREAISFMGGVDPESGLIIEKDHELAGECISGRILVFPVGKGSSLASYRMYEMLRYNTQPSGIINLRADPVVAAGAIISNIPMVDKLEKDLFKLIRTGDKVEIDADRGIVRLMADRRSTRF